MLAVPSPRTFKVQEVEVASFLNSVRDALTFLLNRPIASLYQSTGTSSFSGWVTLSFDSATVDSYGGHSATSNPSRYTAQVSGWYLCSGEICFSSSQTTGFRSAVFQVNGTRYLGSAQDLPASPDSTNIAPATTPIFLNAGDYVEMAAYSSVATTTTTSFGDLRTRFNILFAHA